MTSSNHPESYTAYAFTEKGGELSRITVPWKDPKDGQVVVKVIACGVCGSDEQVPKAIYPIQYPRIPGHEIIGDVVAIPPNETKWKVGDRIGGGWHGGHCHECARCRVGDYITCENAAINGISMDGGYAEYATLRTEAAVRVPKDMDPYEAAPLLCAGITVFNSLRHMNVTPPEVVAVQGIGGLGHIALQIARRMGFRTVALSSSGSKKALAHELGAHEYIDSSKADQAEELQKLGGAKVIMCTAPNAKVIEGLLPGLAVDGTLLLLALEDAPITISPLSMLGKRLSIRGWVCGHAVDSEDMLQFARDHDVGVMVSKFPLDKAQEAYEHRASARFRVVIVPDLP
ncbi:GroES-like protein [Dichomitus squalens]|uniref:GroES-like protein n=1 Tax=Dichomitus squalens TaxID=114155 RepID=A0A4Q9PMU5_9APHY|nr:GroES-like protein [Dichomitus squalens]